MANTVAIYTRISADPDGTQTSTARQERLCRSFCEAREWNIGEVFCDIDRSAFADVERPAYERMLAQIAAGRFDAVLAWRLDRLTRRSAELERLWGVCERTGTALVSATEPVDTTSPTGMALVRMLITFAGLESEVRSQRLRARFRERAESGAAHYGQVGYGHTPGLGDIVEGEAELLREAARRILDGDGVEEITRDWAEQGVLGSRGVPWTANGLRFTLRSHRLAGDREYRGEVVATDCFPAILDRETATRVRHALVATRGRRSRTGPLLRGMVRCGRCGNPMYGLRWTKGGQDAYRYVCAGRTRRCGLSVRGEHLEQWVTDQTLWRLEHRWPRNGRQPRRLSPAQARSIDAHDDRLADLNRAFYVQRSITYAEYVRTRDDLLADAGVVAVDVAPPPGLPTGLDLRQVRSRWPSLDIPARRALIALELNVVEVHRTPRRGGVFDPERLLPRWWPHLPDIEPPPLQGPRTDRFTAWIDRDGKDVPNPDRRRRDDGLLSSADVAEELGMTRLQVDRARSQGLLPVVEGSSPFLFPREAPATYRTRSAALIPPEGFLTEREAAGHLAMSVSALRCRASDGEIDVHHMPNGRRYYGPVELERYLERSRIEPRRR